jgi:hypothetical protein
MLLLFWLQFDFQNFYLSFKRLAGVYSDEVTPDPFPNSEDKLVSGDGTARETVCESSTMPAFFFWPTSDEVGFLFLWLNQILISSQLASSRLLIILKF